VITISIAPFQNKPADYEDAGYEHAGYEHADYEHAKTLLRRLIINPRTLLSACDYRD
tara:strand:- start:168 stop:338 length:171 start_codon:yes stop_codon:yes gene_type:complete